MIKKYPLLIRVAVAMAFVGALLATYLFYKDDWRLFLVSVFSLAVIALVDHSDRRLYPILVIFLCIRATELLFSFLLVFMLGLPFLLLTGLIDCLCAFLLVHYYKDDFLVRWCKVKTSIPLLPQLHWIALLLGVSSFYRVAAAGELAMHEINRDFFGENIPFFFATGPIAMIVIRITIDTLLWSMLLFPRKLSQFGHQRPRNLAS
ncbi:MAG: hypothetical protein J0M22_05085 [Gammaproteobacteria bacterium]|nr:hypothetical protein [Gammaproteobacteria bacterium]